MTGFPPSAAHFQINAVAVSHPPDDQMNDEQFPSRQDKPIVHLIIRGMADRDGIDLEVSSRGGKSCHPLITKHVMDYLSCHLENYSRRSYQLSLDRLFGGGSRYLDYFRNGYPECPDLAGYGENYHVLEIRLSRKLRKLALARIKDVLVMLVASLADIVEKTLQQEKA